MLISKVALRLLRGILDTTLCDKVRKLLATGQWFSPSTLVSSTNITEILLKVALNMITITLTFKRHHSLSLTWSVEKSSDRVKELLECLSY
jgi:hypothetical protein